MDITGAEHAKSGRSSCWKCDTKIPKDAPRLVVQNSYGQYGQKYYCRKCGLSMAKGKIKQLEMMQKFLEK